MKLKEVQIFLVKSVEDSREDGRVERYHQEEVVTTLKTGGIEKEVHYVLMKCG